MKKTICCFLLLCATLPGGLCYAQTSGTAVPDTTKKMQDPKPAEGKGKAADGKPAPAGASTAPPTDTTKKQGDTSAAKKNTGDAAGPSAASSKTPKEDCIPDYEHNNKAEGLGWALVFLPGGAASILMGLLIWRITSTKAAAGGGNAQKPFSLADALNENNPAKITVQNPKYFELTDIKAQLAANPPLAASTIASLTTLAPPTMELSEGEVTTVKQDEKTTVVTTSAVYRPSISRLIALLSAVITLVILGCMASLFIYRYLQCGCPPSFSNLSTILIALGVGVLPYTVNKIATATGRDNAPV